MNEKSEGKAMADEEAEAKPTTSPPPSPPKEEAEGSTGSTPLKVQYQENPETSINDHDDTLPVPAPEDEANGKVEKSPFKEVEDEICESKIEGGEPAPQSAPVKEEEDGAPVKSEAAAPVEEESTSENVDPAPSTDVTDAILDKKSNESSQEEEEEKEVKDENLEDANVTEENATPMEASEPPADNANQEFEVFQDDFDDDEDDDEEDDDDDDESYDEKNDPYSFSDDEDFPRKSTKKYSTEIKSENKGGARPGSSSLDGEDEDRLVIADEYDKKDGLPSISKDNVLTFKGDKPRKKHVRFNGMSEEEVAKRLLPDLIKEDLDILIIGINPGMYAAFKGHHYAGPGNHFWKCMYLGGLIPRPMSADDDNKLVEFGIGFTNVVERTTRGSADLTRKEIEEGSQVLVEKLKKYKPKIAVFNGKGIYEVFSGNKEFHFGKQPEPISGTDTYAWVMPNSSARCAQLPRAVDKVPFYTALKKFKDFLKGDLKELDDKEVVFSDLKLRNFNDGAPKFRTTELPNAAMNSEFKLTDASSSPSEGGMACGDFDIRIDPVTGKKRRGRPPKPRPDGTLPPPKRRMMIDANGRPVPRTTNPIDPTTGKKKRGRPKKADVLAAQAAFEAEMKSNGGGGDIRPRPPMGDKTKRESVDSSDSFNTSSVGGGPGDQDSKVVEAAAPAVSKTSQPLPDFSSNFGRGASAMQQQQPSGSDLNGAAASTPDVKPQRHVSEEQNARLFGDASATAPGGPQAQQSQHQQQQQQPSRAAGSSQHPYPGFNNFKAGAGGPTTTPHHNSFSPVAGNAYNNYNGSPLHAGFDRPGGSGPGAVKPPTNHSPSVRSSGGAGGGGNDDVSTKSITGLESLVDQIPAMAENDSGVFSGSGAGSHPNTPRSVGPYSPAAGAPPPGGQFPSPFHTPNSSNFNVPSTSELGAASSATAAAGPSSDSSSTNFNAPPTTDFSVNSLVHRNAAAAAAAAAAAGAGGVPAGSTGTPENPAITSSFSDSSFSVSSLTSTYANDMAAKYAASAANPYAAGMFGSPGSFAAAGAAAAAGGFLGQNSFMSPHAGGMPPGPMGQAMAGMASMHGAAMSYYGQSYGAPSSGLPPSPYTTHGFPQIPNPGYPYSHYGQSPYSNSPYF